MQNTMFKTFVALACLLPAFELSAAEWHRPTPSGATSSITGVIEAKELVSGKRLWLDAPVKVEPRTTVVLFFGK